MGLLHPSSRLPSDWLWCVSVLAICAVLSAFMRISIDGFAIFLLPLSAEFAWDRSQAVSIYAFSMLSFGLGCLAAGRLMDRLGPAWTYTVGLLLLAAAFLSATYLQSILQFSLIVGLGVGFGAALIGMVSHSVLLSRWYRNNLTTAISLSFAASGMGMLIGAPVLQTMIDAFGWRAAYACLGGAALVGAVILPCLPWRRLRARGADDAPDRALAMEHRQPIQWRATLLDPSLITLFLIQVLTAVSLFALNPQIVAFLVELGFDPIFAAIAFGAAGLAGTIGVVSFGWFADRRGRQAAMILSYSMTTGGFVLLLGLLAWPSAWLVAGFVLIYGPTFGSRGPIINAMVPAMVGRGPGLGFKLGFVQLGLGLGAAAGSTLGGRLRDETGYSGVIILAIVASLAALTLYLSVTTVRRV